MYFIFVDTVCVVVFPSHLAYAYDQFYFVFQHVLQQRIVRNVHMTTTLTMITSALNANTRG